MTPYRDELEELRFTAEEKEALRRRLLTGQRARRPVRLPYRGLVAVVAALSLLIGAAGGATLAGISPTFRALFGVESQEQVQELGAQPMELVFEDRNGSGASLTVLEAVADQERLYLRMEFQAPEGVSLPEPDQVEEGFNRCWLEGDPGYSCGFYEDEDGTVPANPYSGWSYGVEYLADSDPEPGTVELLFTVKTEQGFPEEAAYCIIRGITGLGMWVDGASCTVVDGLDLALTIPLEACTEYYAFDGRSSVKLGGTTMAVVENLTLSSISITMDLIIPDSAAYDAALEAAGGSWPVYVLLADGTQVAARFPEGTSGRLDHFTDEEGTLYFRADHLYLELEQVIDVSQVADIVFVGDNDDAEEPGREVYFQFTSGRFYNHTYWDKVNQVWRDGETTQPPESTVGQ